MASKAIAPPDSVGDAVESTKEAAETVKERAAASASARLLANATVAVLVSALFVGVAVAQPEAGASGLCAFPGGEPVLSRGQLLGRGVVAVIGIIGIVNPSSGGDGSYGGMDSGRLKRIGAFLLVVGAVLLPQILTYVLGWFDSSMTALGLGCVF